MDQRAKYSLPQKRKVEPIFIRDFDTIHLATGVRNHRNVHSETLKELPQGCPTIHPKLNYVTQEAALALHVRHARGWRTSLSTRCLPQQRQVYTSSGKGAASRGADSVSCQYEMWGRDDEGR